MPTTAAALTNSRRAPGHELGLVRIRQTLLIDGGVDQGAANQVRRRRRQDQRPDDDFGGSLRRQRPRRLLRACGVDAGPSRVCGFHAVRLSVHVDVERCGSPVGTILKDTTRTPARTRPTATAPGELTTRSTLRLAVFPAGQFTGRDARGQRSASTALRHTRQCVGSALTPFIFGSASAAPASPAGRPRIGSLG